jgi:flavin reductase (DIM6/NTAB) family NADH-FMN oxidoreductase RutF
MLQPITVHQAQVLTSPNPFALLVSSDQEGRPNLMALSWWTYVSNKPAALAVCLSQKGYSGELIKASNEFALCVVADELKDAAFFCGTCSGRHVDKVAKTGIELVPASQIRTGLVQKSRVAFECKVTVIVPAMDHNLFIAEIVAVHGDAAAAQLFAMQGYRELAAVPKMQ